MYLPIFKQNKHTDEHIYAYRQGTFAVPLPFAALRSNALAEDISELKEAQKKRARHSQA